MIKRVPAATGQITLLLVPNRVLSRSDLRKAIGALTAAALLTAWQGNVFALPFALLEAPCVATALGLAFAWHAGDRAERITLDARSLRVESQPRAATVTFPSAWVRVRLRDWGGHQHVLLAASRREREMGAFLGDEERAKLWEELRSALAGVKEIEKCGHG